MNKNYLDVGNEDNEENNANEEAHNAENIEQNLKQFCGDMESLCEKYEKEIGKYKKTLEELHSNNKNNSNPRKSSNGSDNKEVYNDNNVLIEKCEASTNTDDLSIEDVKEILIKMDNNLTVECKSNFKTPT